MQRIWSEHVPYRELAAGTLLRLLARFELELVVAVTPAYIDEFASLARTLDSAGIQWTAWPMLDNEHGRWASCFNADRFVEFARAALAVSGATSVALDLELPYETIGKVFRGELRALSDLVAMRRAWRERETLSGFARKLASDGVHVTVAVTPLAVAGIRRARGWQKWLGAPIDDIAADRVDMMLYSSLFEGYSAGHIARDDARAILYASARRARRYFGAKAAVSLGVAGVGALGDERPYQSADELADDVAIARAAGITQLSLFDLWGVLDRGEPEAWLRAFTDVSAEKPAPSMTRKSALATLLPTAAGVCLRLM